MEYFVVFILFPVLMSLGAIFFIRYHFGKLTLRYENWAITLRQMQDTIKTATTKDEYMTAWSFTFTFLQHKATSSVAKELWEKAYPLLSEKSFEEIKKEFTALYTAITLSAPKAIQIAFLEDLTKMTKIH